MKQEYLSDIELYYSTQIDGKVLSLSGNEFKHAAKVMRNSVGSELFATNGNGKIFLTEIVSISNKEVQAVIKKEYNYENEFKNIFFCFPRLKSSDRFEFELEKCIELGFTNFIIVNTSKTIPKGEKLERWNKIALSAMKQSLRSFLPNIRYLKSIDELNKISGRKIVFDQNSDKKFKDIIHSFEEKKQKTFFVFGPEGGLTKTEIENLSDIQKVQLTKNRLRAETAVISAASAISLQINGDEK